MIRQLAARICAAFFTLALMPGIAAAQSASRPDPAAETTTADRTVVRVVADSGGEVEVEAGWISVPESRLTASRRKVSIPYYRLKSTAARPAAPIFLLHGGPGSSGLDLVENEENFDEVMFYRSIADVVLFDQRGGGRSLPDLTCAGHSADLAEGEPFSLENLRPSLRAALTACRDHWISEGVDLSAYNTIENAADVDALRATFGYDKITLVGGSYGSHLGLQIMRLYPGIVDRAVFYGVEGPDNTWDSARAKLAALRRIAEAAEQSEELGSEIPGEGLIATLHRVLTRLEQNPVSVDIGSDEQPSVALVNADLVRFIATSQAGRRSNLNAWPEMVLAMNRGDFSTAARARARMRSLALQEPVHYSMDCASGISAELRAQYAVEAETYILGDLNFEYSMLCDLWPTEQPEAAYRETVRSEVPTLLIHGTWDLSTPIENAREALLGLSNGHLVEVSGGGHGALYNLYENWPPMRERMRQFLEGGAAEFPDTVFMPVPRFSAPELGSVPK
ncbi:MAG: alpha/beta fold hydrolase [Brevundimonas sp.]